MFIPTHKTVVSTGTRREERGGKKKEIGEKGKEKGK